MIHVEASRQIERPIQEVWAYIANLDNMPTWDPGLVSVKWQPPLRPGLPIEMHDASPLLRVLDRIVGPFVFTVSDYEEGKSFGVRVSRGRSSLEAIYSLEAVAADRTRVTRTFTIQGYGPWKLLERLLKRRAVREREAEVANLKRYLEARRGQESPS